MNSSTLNIREHTFHPCLSLHCFQCNHSTSMKDQQQANNLPNATSADTRRRPGLLSSQEQGLTVSLCQAVQTTRMQHAWGKSSHLLVGCSALQGALLAQNLHWTLSAQAEDMATCLLHPNMLHCQLPQHHQHDWPLPSLEWVGSRLLRQQQQMGLQLHWLRAAWEAETGGQCVALQHARPALNAPGLLLCISTAGLDRPSGVATC